MHQCREIYTLDEYQTKLKMNALSFAVLLEEKETKKNFLFKPKPRSLWVEEFQKDYLAPRLAKIREAGFTFKYQFMTLTYDTKKWSKEKVAEVHKKHINRFIKAVRKIYPKFQYCYFIEVTKKLYVHFHLFLSKYVKRNIAKNIWSRIAKSFIVHSMPMNNSKILVNYIAKYGAKINDGDLVKLEFMFRHIDRFFACSRHFYVENEKKNSKDLYRFITQLFLPYKVFTQLEDEDLIGSLVDASKFAFMLGRENLGLEFEYNDEGDLRGNFITFDNQQDLVNYYLDFQREQGLSWSNAIDSDNILYVSMVN